MAVILAVIFIVSFSIYTIIKKGYEDVAYYRTAEINRVKQSLKEYVDIVYDTVEANHKNIRDKAYLERQYGPRMQSVIDIAETLIQTKVDAFKNGTLSLEEAQSQALSDIKKIRYDNGKSYVWITDTRLPYPKMLMHPTLPSMDNQILDDPKYNCASGIEQNRFSAAVEICQAHGKGFVDYLWPKATQDGVIPDVPKLAYMRLFEEWQWTVSTAVYVDEAIQEAIDKSKIDIERMKYNNGVGYLWVNSVRNSNLQMIVHTKNYSLENQILTGVLKKKFASFIVFCDKNNGSGHPDVYDELSYVKIYKPLNWMVGAALSKESVEQNIATHVEYIHKQNNLLILSIIIAAVLIILLFIGFIYIKSRFFSKKDTQQETFTRPVTVVQTEQRPQHAPNDMLLTQDCVKMVQEISKTLIAEHAKLLATGFTPQAQQIENTTDILTRKSQQTIAKVKNQVQETSPKMMGNLENMFGK